MVDQNSYTNRKDYLIVSGLVVQCIYYMATAPKNYYTYLSQRELLAVKRYSYRLNVTVSVSSLVGQNFA